jgi:glycosyltransferase involved in cell wall biosynthesis
LTSLVFVRPNCSRTRAFCGLSVPAGDSEGLAQAMLQVIDDPAAFRRKGENGRRYYEENFTKDIFMKRLYAILDKVIRHTKESQ